MYVCMYVCRSLPRCCGVLPSKYSYGKNSPGLRTVVPGSSILYSANVVSFSLLKTLFKKRYPGFRREGGGASAGPQRHFLCDVLQR